MAGPGDVPGQVNPWVNRARTAEPITVNNLYPTDSGPNALEIQLANSLGPYQAPSQFAWAAAERRSNDMLQSMLKQKLYEDEQRMAAAKLQATAQGDAANNYNDLLKSLITSDPQTRAAVAAGMGIDPSYIENILRRENTATVADAAGAVQKFGAASADGYSVPTDWISQNLVPVQRTAPTSTVNAGISAAASGASNPNKYDKVDYWTQDGQHITRNIPMGTDLPPPAASRVGEGTTSTDDGQFTQRYRDQAFAQAQRQDPQVTPDRYRIERNADGTRSFVFQRPNGGDVRVQVIE